MSRILVTGINYAPEAIGTGKYTAEMCEWLAEKGHQIRVVTAPPYYPAWKIWPEFRGFGFHRSRENACDVVRCPLWVPAKPRGLNRVAHLVSFAFSSSLALLASLIWRPQIVICVAPTLASAPAAWLVARLAKAKCWLHIQDFEVDAATDMGIVQTRTLKHVALAAENWLLRRFDVVSTISIRMLERLEKKGVAATKRELFPNWVDIDSIQPLCDPSPYRRELAIPDDAVVALYSGNMGLKQGLELLGNAAQALAREKDLYFVFGGEGPAKPALQEACSGLENVRFLDLQPAERLNDWLGLADIHLLPQRADVADLVMPSKLTGMLASGRAVLATALPGTGVADAVHACGRATVPGDTNAFITSLLDMARNGVARRELGDAARRKAESTLSLDGILCRFERQIACLLGEPPSNIDRQ